MPKKGELSKTARASLGKTDTINHMTKHRCPVCGDGIMLADLQPVKVLGKGMLFYHKEHYKMQ